MEDVTQTTQFADSPQPEAVENIQSAKVYNVSPQEFKQNREAWLPEVRKMKLPPVASRTVAAEMQKSPEHAAAIAPDAKNLSMVEKIWGDISNKISNRIGPEREINDLLFKKLGNKGQLEENDEYRLEGLKLEQTNNFGRKNMGLDGFWENLPGDVAAGVVDLGAMAVRNKGLIGTITGGTAATFGGIGAVTAGPAGAIAGVVSGTGTGLLAGFTAAGFWDGYKSMAGASYGAFDDYREEGTNLPMDENTKMYLAHGVGAVAGGIQAVTDRALLKGLPFLKSFLNPRTMAGVLSKPANSALKTALINIGKSVATNSAGESAQELVAVLGEEIGNSYKNGEVSFNEGLIRAGQKLANDPKTQERVKKTAVVGGLVGGTLHAGFGTVAKGVEYVGAYKNAKVKAGAVPSENVIDVNPEGQAAVPLESRVAPETPTSEMTPSFPVKDAATQVLEFQNAVEETGKLAQQTDLGKQAPQMVSEIQQKMLESQGLKKVWFDKADLQAVATDEESAAKIRNAIDPSGTAAAAIDAPFSMQMHKFLDLVNDGLPIDEYARLHPEGPNPKSAEQFAKNIEAANAKRQQLSEKLGVMGEKDPAQRASSLALNPDLSDGDIAVALTSKEVADSYLARLDMNEQAEMQTGTPEAVAQIAKISNMRDRVKIIRETLPDETNAKDALKQAIDTTFPENNIYTEEQFLNEATFTKEVEGVLPKNEVEKKNAAIRDSKQAIVDVINESAKLEMNKVIDITVQEAMDAQKLTELDKLENSMFLVVSERFNPPGATEQSAFAIDPKYLSKEQKKAYGTNKQLKEHKAWKEGGMSPDEAAEMVGVSDGNALLSILANTPKREDVAETRAKMFEPTIREEAIATTDLNETAIAKAYHNKTRNDLQTAEIMRDAHWTATKKGIKRAALPLAKRIEALTIKAKNTVDQTAVGDLNVNQFKTGQRKNHRIAVDSELKGDYDKASRAKEAEAFNTELTLATQQAIGDVNKIIRFVRKFKDPKVVQQLRDAGSLKAVEEILDVWNFSPSKKNSSERGAYQKWVKQQVEEGNGNFEIPERLSDLRESIDEMTVEQVKVIGDRLKTILHQAKMKNELYAQFGEEAQAKVGLEELATEFHDAAVQHPDYDGNRSIPKQGDITPFERVMKGLSDGVSMLKGMEHIILNADMGKVGGFLNDKIMAPLKGIGKFKGQGEEGKQRDAIALQRQMETVIKTFGEKEWSELKNEKVFVPEFEGNPRLNFGRMSKWNLFRMLLNMGNESNQKRMIEGFTQLDGKGVVEFTTDLETVKTVLNRELGDNFAVAAQNIWNMYASYWPRVVKLHEDTTGITPDFIEAKPVDHNGKRYDGGYFPLVTEADMSLDRIRKSTQQTIDAGSGEVLAKLTDFHFADDMTRHSHTEARTNSKLPIDISGGLGMHFEMLIHDLNFRKPIRDSLKILTHPTISKDIANMVGIADYNVLVNTVVRAAGSMQAENTALFDSTRLFNRLEAQSRATIQAGYLIGNMTSIMIQPTSMIQATERLGVSGVPHIINTLAQMGKDPTLVGQYYEFAGDINPTIRDVIQGIDENLKDPLRKLEPNRNINKVTKKLDKLSEKVNDFGYKLLGQMDQIQKVVITLSAYSQFMAGDADGHPLSVIQKMSPKDRDHAAKVYASSATRLTLTAGSTLDRAPIQHQYKWLTMFFNDARNQLNNVMRQSREIRWNFQAGEYGDAATNAVAMLTTLALIRSYTDVVRGYNTPWANTGERGHADERFDKRKLENFSKFAPDFLAYLATAPADVIFGNIPIARDINFGLQSADPRPWKQKDVLIAPAKVVNDLYHATNVGLRFMDKIIQGKKRSINMSYKEREAVGFTVSYLTPRGLPVKTLFKLYDALGKTGKRMNFVTSLADEYKSKFESFKADYSSEVSNDEMEALEDIYAGLKPESLDNSDQETKD